MSRHPAGPAPPTGGDARRVGTSPSPLLRDGDRILVPLLLLFALYLLLAGHNRPGGGFVAGLTVASAVVLRAQGRSVVEALRLLPVVPVRMLAFGLLLAALTAVAPLLFGLGVLDQPFVEVELPVFATVKLTSALVFDIGVAVVVVGVVGAILDAFGDEEATGAVAARAVGEVGEAGPGQVVEGSPFTDPSTRAAAGRDEIPTEEEGPR